MGLVHSLRIIPSHLVPIRCLLCPLTYHFGKHTEVRFSEYFEKYNIVCPKRPSHGVYGEK